MQCRSFVSLDAAENWVKLFQLRRTTELFLVSSFNLLDSKKTANWAPLSPLKVSLPSDFLLCGRFAGCNETDAFPKTNFESPTVTHHDSHCLLLKSNELVRFIVCTSSERFDVEKCQNNVHLNVATLSIEMSTDNGFVCGSFLWILNTNARDCGE